MSSAQDCAKRLREQAYRTLLPQIRDLEQELQTLANTLSSGVQHIGRRLDGLRNIELPTTEVVLGEILDEIKLQREKEIGSLALFAQSLCQKETQEEILALLLDGAHKFFPRVALFAVRGDRFVGWSSRGYSEARAQGISSSSFLRSECEPLEKALKSDVPLSVADIPEGQGPMRLLQEKPAEPWHLMPLRALKRPVALVMASGVDSAPFCGDALYVLTELTSLRLENLALKILHELVAAEPETLARPQRDDLAAVPAPSPAPVQPGEEVAAAAPEPQEFVELPPLPAVPVAEHEEMPAAQAEAPPETLFAAAPPSEPAKAQIQEPFPIGEEEKLHADARRFARLLISEVKLYNEHHVVEGRENRDLYIRLKRDIDRSREMYEKRISPVVASKIDYLHDEIIRILGDNDPSALGSDYPGPRVEN